MNETIEKFGYPASLVAAYDHWVVLVRRTQITAGSVVLAHAGSARGLPEVPAPDFAELARVTADLEAALRAAFRFDKINYLLLMMVDPQVHFHVIPRYATPRDAIGLTFPDDAWPGPPDVRKATSLTDDQLLTMRELLAGHWPAQA